MPTLSWEVSQGCKLVALIHFPVGLSRMLLELSSNMVTNSQEYYLKRKRKLPLSKGLGLETGTAPFLSSSIGQAVTEPIHNQEKGHKSHESDLMNVEKMCGHLEVFCISFPTVNTF